MKRFIFEERNGLYIIDLAKTLQQIRNAVEVVKEIVGKHRSILFVGTKKQAKSVVRELAEAVRRILRLRTLARWHAHQPDHHPPIDQKTRTNRKEDRHRRRRADKERAFSADKRSDQTRKKPLRRPRHAQTSRAWSSSSTQAKNTLLSLKPTSWAFLSWGLSIQIAIQIRFNTSSPATTML